MERRSRSYRPFIANLLFVALIFACAISVLYAQTEDRQRASQARRPAYSRRMDIIRMTDFYLRNGKHIKGRLIEETKNSLTVEELADSKLVVNNYPKNEVDTRRVDISTMPEASYYINLAEAFYSNTWDFRDDPDEFQQAIRSYEKAKQILSQSPDRYADRIAKLDTRIENLRQERQKWIEEAKNRAKMQELEFQATVKDRLESLEQTISENQQNIDQAIQQMNQTVSKVETRFLEVRRDVAQLEQDLSDKWAGIQDRVKTNTQLLRDLRLTRDDRYYPDDYYRGYPRRRRDVEIHVFRDDNKNSNGD